MMKRICSVFLVVIICLTQLTIGATAASVATVAALKSPQSVIVDGENIDFFAYLIGGNNYFKIRDLAFILSGSEKQFDIDFNGSTNSIYLAVDKSYTVVGGEMTSKGIGNKSAITTKTKVYLDEEEIQLTAYNIENNNYFKLRDIGRLFDFGVDFDAIRNTIFIDTSKGYTPEDTEGIKREWDGVLEAGTLLMGDSLTYHLIAQYLRPKGYLGNASYMTMCSTELRHYFSDSWVLYSWSKYGALCSSGLYGLPLYKGVEKTSGKYNSVFFLLGSNGSTAVTQEAYEKTLDHLLAAYPNATIYIQTVPYSAKGIVDAAWVNSCVRGAVESYHERGIANIVLLDTNSIWDASCMTADTVHLTEEGNRRWYELIVEMLR